MITEKGILRIVDANYNRCKEGLRVVEDIFRFALCDDKLRKEIRKVRHSLDDLARQPIIRKGILSRNSKHDPGRKVDALEIKRADIKDLIYVNFQRAKESLRVLEEFFKIALPSKVAKIKRNRYRIYTLERQVIYKLPALFKTKP